MEKFQTCVCREKANGLSRGSGITRNVCSVLGGCDCRRAAPPCGVARRDLGFWRTVDMGKGAGLVSLWGCDRHMKRH